MDINELRHFEREKALQEALSKFVEDLAQKLEMAGVEFTPTEWRRIQAFTGLLHYPTNLKAALFAGMRHLKKSRFPASLRNSFASEPRTWWDLYLAIGAAFEESELAELVGADLQQFAYILDELANPMSNPNMGRNFGRLNSQLSENESLHFVAIATDALKGFLLRREEGDIIYWLMTLPIWAASADRFSPFETDGEILNPYSLSRMTERVISDKTSPSEVVAAICVRIGNF